MEKIYIYLTQNGLRTCKPVQAERVAPGIYVIAEQPHDKNFEQWEFEPGQKVKCDEIIMGGKSVFIASERVE